MIRANRFARIALPIACATKLAKNAVDFFGKFWEMCGKVSAMSSDPFPSELLKVPVRTGSGPQSTLQRSCDSLDLQSCTTLAWSLGRLGVRGEVDVAGTQTKAERTPSLEWTLTGAVSIYRSGSSPLLPTLVECKFQHESNIRCCFAPPSVQNLQHEFWSLFSDFPCLLLDNFVSLHQI